MSKEELNRDQMREILAKKGITNDVTIDQIKLLRRIINKHLKKSGIYNGTARLFRQNWYKCEPKHDPSWRYLTMNTEQWKKREAVSFNRDGFIGVAGWASDTNAAPIISAMIEWSDLVWNIRAGEQYEKQHIEPSD
jgi:hypothetical protein